MQILAPTAEHATGLAEQLGTDGTSVTGGGIDEQITGEVVVLVTPYAAAVEFA